ncbi:MAG: hypothetical protein JWQ28_3277, partial [Pedobacter sp.]|nr:hypothetical protein [Pedobacter sp.]
SLNMICAYQNVKVITGKWPSYGSDRTVSTRPYLIVKNELMVLADEADLHFSEVC